jgi:prepilin-type N-terminal cleavage/methylation domain-containing protein
MMVRALRGAGPVWREGGGGFTLIEVMVALAILSTALFVLLQAHYGSLRLYDDSRDQVTRRALLEWAVGKAELEVHGGTLSGSGEYSKRFPDTSYSFEATPIGDDSGVGLLDVVVRVSTAQEEQEMSFFVYDMRQR